MLKKIWRVLIMTALVSALIFPPASFAEMNGVVRFPIDLSYLADNPPKEKLETGKNLLKAEVGEDPLPSAYDLRKVNGKSYVTSVKNQGQYNWCWAFSAIGAMASNYLMQGGEELDLSVMHLAWFTFKNSDKSKAFKNFSSSNFDTIKSQGGNSFYPAAIYGRLDGPALESDVPFGTAPSAATPGSYSRALRLRDVYYISFSQSNVNASTEARNIIKRRIMQNGAVVANYNNNQYEYYKASDGSTSFFTSGTSLTHAVQIIGWNDNYSRANFKTKPSIDGAWLIKNSWGDTWSNGSTTVGDNGCFWMSYEQYLDEGSAYVVEAANDDMKAYYYDALGWTTTMSYSNVSSVYSANVFKSERDGEYLTEVGFYTPDNNIDYEIKIYTGMSSMPSSTPVNGSAVSTQSGTIPFAGYHTVTLDSPVALTNGEYFSVVVRMSGNKIPFEAKNDNMSQNFKAEKGSFYSYNSTYWTAATDRNSCIKAFTLKDSAAGVPAEITSSYPPDAVRGAEYYYKLTAKGTRPITWSMTGTLPAGLEFDTETGVISGTPTTVQNSVSFSITVTNTINGETKSDTKNYTMNVIAMPTIKTTELKGYIGYTFSGTLELSSSMSATWSITSGSLPKGLSLNSSSGVISGKPSKAGTYPVTFTATTTYGSVSSRVNIIINSRPVKPKINTSKFSEGTVGRAYSQRISFSGTEPVTFAIENLPDGLTFDTSTGELSGTPESSGIFTMNVTAENIYTQLNRTTVTKNVKITIRAIAPIIASPSDMPIAVLGEDYEDYQFSLSSESDSVEWSASGLPRGMTLSSAGLLTGTPLKAGNFNMTIKAANNGGKTSLKVPFTVYEVPTITKAKFSDATTGKKYTAKLTAKGTGPITWDISNLPDTLTVAFAKNGLQATISGTPTEAGTYELGITASNSVGSDETTVNFTVKGVAPKLKASLPKAKVGSAYSASISATGTLPIYITYTISDSDKNKFGIDDLDDLGLTFTSDPSTGTAMITGTPTQSIKSLPIYLSASNTATTTTASKKVSFTASGTKPNFASATEVITKSAGETLSLSVNVTGSKQITFSMNAIGGLYITQDDEDSATISGTAPSKAGKYNIKVTAANADGKATKKITLRVTNDGTGDTAPKTVSETPEEISATEKEIEADDVNEEVLTNAPAINFGSEREISSIRAIDADALDGCTIAAVLPELTVSESNMYDIEVDIAPEIEAGKKLLWFAFPQNREKTDDDDIVEFYDADGSEITATPEGHKILISVWLNSGDVYAPVVAVKDSE